MKTLRCSAIHRIVAESGGLLIEYDDTTTAVGLSIGLAEANPLGVLTLPIKYAMNEHSKTLPLHECIASRKVIGGAGWGAAAANVAAIAGLGPIGLVVGLAVGVYASQSVADDAPIRCIE